MAWTPSTISSLLGSSLVMSASLRSIPGLEGAGPR